MNKRNFAVLSIAGLVLLLVATTAFAQSATVVKVSVPFDFKVENTTYPAGNYMITFPFVPHRESVLLSTADGHALSFINTHNRMSSQKRDLPYLLFRGYGNQYFLAEISYGSGGQARALVMSKAEREIVKSAGKLAKALTVREVRIGAH